MAIWEFLDNWFFVRINGLDPDVNSDLLHLLLIRLGNNGLAAWDSLDSLIYGLWWSITLSVEVDRGRLRPLVESSLIEGLEVRGLGNALVVPLLRFFGLLWVDPVLDVVKEEILELGPGGGAAALGSEILDDREPLLPWTWWLMSAWLAGFPAANTSEAEAWPSKQLWLASLRQASLPWPYRSWVPAGAINQHSKIKEFTFAFLYK